MYMKKMMKLVKQIIKKFSIGRIGIEVVIMKKIV